jgi:hypothetical protein
MKRYLILMILAVCTNVGAAISKEQAVREYIALFEAFKKIHDKDLKAGKQELTALKQRYEYDKTTDPRDMANQEAGVAAIYEKYGVTVNEAYFGDKYTEIQMTQNQNGKYY